MVKYFLKKHVILLILIQVALLTSSCEENQIEINDTVLEASLIKIDNVTYQSQPLTNVSFNPIIIIAFGSSVNTNRLQSKLTLHESTIGEDVVSHDVVVSVSTDNKVINIRTAENLSPGKRYVLNVLALESEDGKKTSEKISIKFNVSTSGPLQTEKSF